MSGREMNEGELDAALNDMARDAVTPPRETLHERTMEFLNREAMEHARYPQYHTIFAYAATCVREVAALQEGMRLLNEEIDTVGNERDKWREREASVCPEDFGFEEVIKSLRAENARLASALREIANKEEDADDDVQHPYGHGRRGDPEMRACPTCNSLNRDVVACHWPSCPLGKFQPGTAERVILPPQD